MKKIGIIAGSGRFPLLVAEEIKKSGDQAIVVGIQEETDPGLGKIADKMTLVPLGQLQKLIDAFHEEQVSTAIMVGRVKHSHLFANLNFDWRAIKLLGSLANKKTDSILGAVAAEFSKENITLLPSHIYLKHLLPKPGILAGPKLSKTEKADIEFGHGIAKHIAGLDIGQTVVVKDKAVIAVEAMEGTDECIRRAAALGREGTIIVKVAKPNQDWRFDLPVIGPRTTRLMAEGKVRVLAIEAGATIMIDRDELLEIAEKNGITVMAFEADKK